jgi:hypothetical protein
MRAGKQSAAATGRAGSMQLENPPAIAGATSKQFESLPGVAGTLSKQFETLPVTAADSLNQRVFFLCRATCCKLRWRKLQSVQNLFQSSQLWKR